MIKQSMISIENNSFKGKKVIVRVDFNVPLDENSKVSDNSRIKASLPTVKKLISDGARVILMSHLGRPSGIEEKFSMKNIIFEVEKVFNLKIKFADDILSPLTQKKVKDLKPNEILLLENLRFYKGEKQGDHFFAKRLASFADCYVNDAFGTSHRSHASTTIIAQFFKNKKFSGFLIDKEVRSIKKVLKDGKSPVLAILGGSKVSSKISIINSLIEIADDIIIGGGMAFTFIKALGGEIGNSICETDRLGEALRILKTAHKKKVSIHLPVDVICSKSLFDNQSIKTFMIKEIPKNWEGFDSGPESLKIFDKIILKSKTILWNGPVGVFEEDRFSHGTVFVGNSIAKSTKNGAFSLVGGGDSVSAAKKFNFQDKVSYISTGGGAMLESLEGKELPGIKALSN